MSATVTTPRRRATRKAGADTQEARYVQTVAHFAAQAGLNLEALAERSGVSRDRLTAMVNGRLPVAGAEALALARVLGVGPEEIQSGPAGPQVSGAALLVPGAVLSKVDRDRALYELGERDAPPAGPRSTTLSAAVEVAGEEMPWTGQTTWGAVFGAATCGWSRHRHEGVFCP